jgi:uncharacterized protein (DUF302 family)
LRGIFAIRSSLPLKRLRRGTNDMSASREVRKNSIEHRILRCGRSFERVHDALIRSVPALDLALVEMLTHGEKEKVEAARRELSKLWIFSIFDHGALTAADGQNSKAMQYVIGNPLTAERMTRHHLAAGLYAPLRVILYEDKDGHAIFEYDLPSSLFGQFGDDRITSVGLELDAELETALAAVA